MRFDAATPAPRPAAPNASAVPPLVGSLVPWAAWARIGRNARLTPTISAAPGVEAFALACGDGTARAGVLVVNTTDAPLRARVEARLPTGLWRGDAALVPYYVTPPGTDAAWPVAPIEPPRVWRMAGTVLRAPGVVVKTVRVGPRRALLLRWDETVAGALAAVDGAEGACRRCENPVIQRRVGPALESIRGTLDTLPVLVARGDREKIVKKAHAALLATGKAQAVWQNLRDPAAENEDAAFDGLTAALSEVSLAACGLVPSESVVADPDGRSAVRLTVTNAGPRAVPLVSLGLPRRRDGGLPTDRAVFRGVRPGATIAASFPLPAGADPARIPAGNVQFIHGNGAALVVARPAAPGDAETPPE